MHAQVPLDEVVPRMASLALTSPDRPTRVACCELLHAVALYMVRFQRGYGMSVHCRVASVSLETRILHFAVPAVSFLPFPSCSKQTHTRANAVIDVQVGASAERGMGGSATQGGGAEGEAGGPSQAGSSSQAAAGSGPKSFSNIMARLYPIILQVRA